MLSARGVALRFPGTTMPALDAVSLDVAAGERVVVVGPSGCGKSSLLRVLSGLRPPDAGAVSLDDAPLPPGRDRSGRRAWHRRVLLLPQDTHRAFNPALRLRTQFHAALALHGRGADAAERERIAAAALARCGVPPDALGRHADDLSGGQRQRAALARLLCLRPRMLLLDEPTAALDPATAADLLSLLDALRRENGFGVLAASHDARLAIWADRTATMRDGRLLLGGATVRSPPA